MIHRATRTSLASECETKWKLTCDGWRANECQYVDVASAVGTAIHAATAAIDLGRDETDDGESKLEAQLVYYAALGVKSKRVEDALANAGQRYRAAVASYVDTRPMRDYEIVDVELTLYDFGGTTIDRGLRTSTGALGVGDIKTKTLSSQYYKDRYVDEFATLSQMRHYTAGYSLYRNESVTYTVLVLCDLKPARPRWETFQYPVSQAKIAYYLDTATVIWDAMDEINEGVRPPRRAISCHGRYGRCEFFNACWRYDGDPSFMRHEYVQLDSGSDANVSGIEKGDDA